MFLFDSQHIFPYWFSFTLSVCTFQKTVLKMCACASLPLLLWHQQAGAPRPTTTAAWTHRYTHWNSCVFQAHFPRKCLHLTASAHMHRRAGCLRRRRTCGERSLCSRPCGSHRGSGNDREFAVQTVKKKKRKREHTHAELEFPLF